MMDIQNQILPETQVAEKLKSIITKSGFIIDDINNNKKDIKNLNLNEYIKLCNEIERDLEALKIHGLNKIISKKLENLENPKNDN